MENLKKNCHNLLLFPRIRSEWDQRTRSNETVTLFRCTDGSKFICRETNTVPDRTTATLFSVIKHCVLPETTVISGMWISYNDITNVTSSSRQSEHLTVNHSENFVDPQTSAHIQTVKS